MTTKCGLTKWLKTTRIKIFFDKLAIRSARSKTGNFKDTIRELLVWLYHKLVNSSMKLQN
jgi:hypothetical protein